MPSKKQGNKKGVAPKKAASRKGNFAMLAQDGHDSGGEEELPMGNEDWMAEQRRMLEMYNSQAKGSSRASQDDDDAIHDPASAKAIGQGDVDEETPTAIVERQRALLEAAQKKNTGSSGGGSSSSTMLPPAGTVGRRLDVDEVFTVRRISFNGRKVPTLLQNRDGPCALLAVANGLLLRGTLELDRDQVLVSADALISLLVKLCEDLNKSSMKRDANAHTGVSEVVGRLPILLGGLLLNCGFSSCTDFEFTVDLGLFDFLGLRLYHTWVAPEIHEVTPTYNALSEHLAVCSELRSDLDRHGGVPTPVQDERLAQGFWLEQWLQDHRSQSTRQGLVDLQAAVKNQEICVLFRNNHFNTVYKANDEVICALLTDSWFEEELTAVWESVELDGCSGHILGSDFRPMLASTEAGEETAATSDRDDLIALVESMGFSRVQAEAGLAATGWTSAEEALEAILEAPNGMPAVKTAPKRQKAKAGEVQSCPQCGKVFATKNGLLDHRASKGH